MKNEINERHYNNRSNGTSEVWLPISKKRTCHIKECQIVPANWKT